MAAGLFQSPSLIGEDDYQYTRLPPNNIRLLTILDGRSPPSCRLDVFSLTDCPPFDALSYTWEDPTLTETITCSRRRLRVTTNVKQALARIAGTGYRGAIWIDAVCINQSDDEEKLDQIPLMEHIYSTATRVIVWLGEEADQSDQALELIRELNEKLNFHEQSKGLPIRCFEDCGLLPETSDGWLAVNSFYKRSWFLRVWTLQEIVLSKEAVVLCGPDVIPWPDIVDATVFRKLPIHMRYIALLDDARAENHYSLAFFAEMLRRTLSHDTTDPNVLWSILQLSILRQCSLPEDHVLGIVGLVGRYFGVDVPINSRAHYTEVYRQFTAWIIQRAPTLSPFYFVDNIERHPDLPSWCPNLESRPRCSVSLHHLIQAEVFNAGFRPSHPRYSFSSRLRDPHTLCVPGLRADKVAAVLPSITFEDMLSGVSAWPECWERCKRLAQTIYGSESTPEACRELINWGYSLVPDNRNPRQQIEPERAQLAHSNVSPGTARDIFEHGMKLLDPERLSEFRERINFGDPRFAIFIMAVSLFFGRVFFSTDNGRIGLGPSRTAPGDEICVFHGGGTPFVVRFEEGEETGALLGECCVYGLMNAEALDMEERGELKTEDILLA
jgi:hypothetical protein